MKTKHLILLSAALVIAALFVVNPQPVEAGGLMPPPEHPLPAAGSWVWDNQEVIGTVIPQYVLAPTYEQDYALLQSEGIHLNGGAQLCHPYRGGQFGWTAEIRVLTSSGWQQVPTVNEWVPDEEGKFMTCAQTWYSGTYAVFGSWEKYEGWQQCPVEGFSTYFGSLESENAYFFGENGLYKVISCTGDGGINTEPPIGLIDAAKFRVNHYCCNRSIYLSDSPVFGPGVN